jgi:protein-tyrosine phosphatase
VVLAQANIKVVLSLCSEQEGLLPADISSSFRCARLPLPDSRYVIPIQPDQLEKALVIIDRCVQSKLPIYVHCQAGVERAPLVCSAYLCRYRRLDPLEAIRWVKQVHPRSSLTPAQLSLLRRSFQEP